MARSQRTGFSRKASVAISTLRPPEYAGWTIELMSPQSCASGSHETNVVSMSYPCAPAIIASFARTLRCERRTPLGLAIAPEVYWMIASVLSSISGGLHANARSSGTVSTSPHSKPSRCERSSNMLRTTPR